MRAISFIQGFLLLQMNLERQLFIDLKNSTDKKNMEASGKEN